MIESALTLGAPQFWGLVTAYVVQLLVAAMLVAVLMRSVPDIPGPGWWLAGILVSLGGMLLAGAQMETTVPWRRAVYVLGDATLLIGIGLIGEGLRRFFGHRPRLLAVGAFVAAEVLVGDRKSVV